MWLLLSGIEQPDTVLANTAMSLAGLSARTVYRCLLRQATASHAACHSYQVYQYPVKLAHAPVLPYHEPNLQHLEHVKKTTNFFVLPGPNFNFSYDLLAQRKKLYSCLTTYCKYFEYPDKASIIMTATPQKPV